MYNCKQENVALVPELEEVFKEFQQELNAEASSEGSVDDGLRFSPLQRKRSDGSEDLEFESVLRKAGVTTPRLVDKNTPVIIQNLLQQKNVLTPFIANKISQVSIPKSFTYHPWDETFNSIYQKLNKSVVPINSPAEKSLLNIKGFYHPATGAIHVRRSCSFGEALLLSIQKFSPPGFRGFFGHNVYLGVGYYFTNLLLREQGLEVLKNEDLKAQLQCAEILVGVAGLTMLGKAYFQNHIDLIKYLQTKTRIGPISATELAGDALCKSKFLRTARFASHHVENMIGVGRTGARSVRLWMRSAMAGPHEIQITGGSGGTRTIKTLIPSGNAGDNTLAVNYPNSPNQPALNPLTKYRYKIIRTADRALIGEGSFETAPASEKDTPEKTVIALISCHQPFADNGGLDPRSVKMLKILPRVLKENNVKFVIPCGDQIYSDNPGIFSIFSNSYLVRQVFPKKEDIMTCTADQVRSLFDMRYRTCWSMKAIQDMYANYPCYPIMDDHDIKNSWGTRREHSDPRYSNVYKGALEAYYDYQASRVMHRKPILPGSFHYNFSYGNIGVFVMDLRSGRFVRSERQSRMFSPKQLEDFRQFLLVNANKKVLFIVTSVPVFFVPEWMSHYGSKVVSDTFEDHWSHARNLPDRDAFLKLLHAHRQANPHQVITILSGDVHIGNACSIQLPGSKNPWMYQFTSSPLTVNETAFTKWQVKQAPIFDTSINKSFDFPCGSSGTRCSGVVRHLPGVQGASRNPFVDMNIGLIEVQRSGDISKLKFKLVGYHPTEDRPVTYFESNWLG